MVRMNYFWNILMFSFVYFQIKHCKKCTNVAKQSKYFLSTCCFCRYYHFSAVASSEITVQISWILQYPVSCLQRSVQSFSYESNTPDHLMKDYRFGRPRAPWASEPRQPRFLNREVVIQLHGKDYFGYMELNF